MFTILAFVTAVAITAQAYVIPGYLGDRGMGLGAVGLNGYNSPTSFSELAGGVANSVASSLGTLGRPLESLGGPLGGLGASLGDFGRNGFGGIARPGAYYGIPPNSGLLGPQGLNAMEYGRSIFPMNGFGG